VSPRSLAFISLLIAGGLTGCGAATTSAGKFQGAEAKVAATVDALSTAATSHDTTKICTKIFSPMLSATLKTKGGSCTSVVAKGIATVDTFNVPVQSVKITGSTAQATVKSTSNGKDRTDVFLLMAQPDGTWRITGLR